MKLVVTGSREGRPDVWYWLDRWVRRFGAPELVILGGARGVDTQAREWAIARGYAYKELFADWKRYGRAMAGKVRNQQMVNEAGTGDWCLAFPTPASSGTWDCLGRAKKAGLQTCVCPLRGVA